MACIAFESGRHLLARREERRGSRRGRPHPVHAADGRAAAHHDEQARRDDAARAAGLCRPLLRALARPAAQPRRSLLPILWPAGIGQPDSAVLFTEGGAHPALYLQNAGLDVNHDGDITRGEVTARVRGVLAEGLLAGNAA